MCRADEEDVKITLSAIEVLTAIGGETSLRYAIHLITAAHLVAKRRKAESVDVQDVKKVYSLFLDETRSRQYLEENESQFMFGSSAKGGEPMLEA